MTNVIIKRMSNALVLALALARMVMSPAHAQLPGGSALPTLEHAVIQPAIDGIFDAFKTYPLVGLSDKHGLAQEMELYAALIRDPRFARTVGNVVVEFGGASRQDVIDRYVNGENVPYQVLRQVWTNTVGWLPTVQYLGYAHFFDQVRQTNAMLPPGQRIRVWLGEPPIDWGTIKTKEDYLAFVGQYPSRDRHAAGVIVQHILARNGKALVIYGGQHFGRVSAEETALRKAWAEADPKNAEPPSLSLQGLVESEHPDAFFIAQVYDGFDEACTPRFEQGISGWPFPALATPVRGTTLERDMRLCPSQANVMFNFPPSMPQALRDVLRAKANDVLFRGDAVLFLGPATSLTRSPLFPDLYLDGEYRQEINRQVAIKTGRTPPPEWGRDSTIAPLPFRLQPGAGK
jgi:hypothetical protein